MKQLPLLLAPLVLAGCVTVYPPDGDRAPGDVAFARFGETANLSGAAVTPLTLLEDSRCPQGVQCVWAGQVRITARIALGSGSAVRELTSGKPIQVADRMLTLTGVEPVKRKDTTIAPGEYRFGFRFDGGP